MQRLVWEKISLFPKHLNTFNQPNSINRVGTTVRLLHNWLGLDAAFVHNWYTCLVLCLDMGMVLMVRTGTTLGLGGLCTKIFKFQT